MLIVALVALAALAAHAIHDLPPAHPNGRPAVHGGSPAAVALIVAAGALVVLGAALGSLSADVQQIVAAGRWGQGWRDSAVTMPAGALLLAAAGHLVRPRRAVLIGLVVLLAAGATVSTAANKRFRDAVAATPAARLDDRLAQSVAEFDPTPAGTARRCALRAEFFAMFAGAPFSLRRFDQSFDAAAEQRAGVPYCPR